ncbi:MSS1 [[Candida] subhashii]|uniref:MSS1 n=1 Tax=[Candida] subhashii TaxID=561895 RepID=A0A8J5QQN2_9ASCO|nr:MSS1 [[Candida] subhashii]KAG7664688.1 MSS1 [[Candida] subhashii]
MIFRLLQVSPRYGSKWYNFRSLSTHIQPKNDLSPTIFALSTKLGKSAIAVIRISGPQSQYIYHQLTKSTNPPKNRFASVRKLYSSSTTTQLLDEALTIYLPGPKTYTGQDLLELHLHGGIAIIRSVLEAIKQLHDPNNGVIIRQAEPGEFSRQAFLNGRFDLTELEGISEMINAETESQRIATLASMTGKTKGEFLKWRQDILNNIANLTTIIDFGEDQDLEETLHLLDDVGQHIMIVETEIKQYLEKVKSSEVLLRGIQLALLGPPNAGKSSILNILANKEAAIVSEIAGTTRDVIDIPLEIGGYKVVLGDTAGIRSINLADQIEQEGIKRAKAKSLNCEFVVVVIDPIAHSDLSELKDHLHLLLQANKSMLIVLNKEDLYPGIKHRLIEEYSEKLDVPTNLFRVVSCSTGSGISELRNSLIHEFKVITQSETSDPIIVSSRIQDLLENDVLYGFQQFYHWKDQDDVVLAAESLRQSVEGIGKITGQAIGIEEILGVVFSNFCIGK